MFPGRNTRITEETIALTTTIVPKADLSRVTDTTSTTVLATITPPFAGFSGVLWLVNDSGANMTTVTTGNIAVARTVPVSMPIAMVYSKLSGKWYVGAIS